MLDLTQYYEHEFEYFAAPKCTPEFPISEVGNMIARRYVCGEGTERNPEKAKEHHIKGML